MYLWWHVFVSTEYPLVIMTSVAMEPTCSPIAKGLVWEAYFISWEAFLNWFGCCMDSGFNAEWQLIYHFDWRRLLGASTCNNGVVPIPLHGLVRAGIIILLSKEVFPQHLPTWWKFIVGNWLNTYMVVSEIAGHHQRRTVCKLDFSTKDGQM